MRFKYWVVLAQFSLAINIAILVSVVLNLDWVKNHAAGGQYTSFPIWIRIIYLFMTLVMVFLILMLQKHKQSPVSPKGPLISKIISWVFVVSTFLQLISKSSAERWNAIPAAIIALTFYMLSKRESGGRINS